MRGREKERELVKDSKKIEIMQGSSALQRGRGKRSGPGEYRAGRIRDRIAIVMSSRLVGGDSRQPVF